MGRKSKTKKLVREIIQDQDEKIDKKKVKKQLKKSLKKSPTKTKKSTKETQSKPSFKLKLPQELKITIKNRKLFGFFLAIIFTITLFTFVYFIFLRVFRPVDVAKYLPEDKVVFLAQFNIDPRHNQLNKALNLFETKTSFNENEIKKIFNQLTPYNFDADITPWIGRKIAFTSLSDSQNQIQNFIFVEYRNQESALFFQKNHAPQATFIDSYLVFGQGSLLEEIQNPINTLAASTQYRKSLNNLPYHHFIFSYFNFANLNDNFLNSIPLISTLDFNISSIKPLFSGLKSEALAIFALQDNFVLQSYLSLDTAVIDNANYLKRHQKYHGDLLKLLNQEVIAFWGGENLEIQMRRLLEIINAKNANGINLFDRLISTYTEKYFGPDINFNQDILPLLRNEFLFSINSKDSGNTLNYQLTFELDSPQEAALKLHDIANSFASMGAVFEPQVVTHILPDGTEGREIIAIPEKIIKDQSLHNSIPIYELKMGTQNWGIYYTMTDNIVIFANNKEQLILSLDLSQNQEQSFISSAMHQKSILPVLRKADEVTFIDLQRALPLFLKKSPPTFLQNLKAISTGRSYFNDGIMTINYIDLN